MMEEIPALDNNKKQMQGLQLSVIVPAYNVSEYLKKCVESLLNQDLSKYEYEIIVINAGSTDDTEKVALELSRKYSQIHVYTKKNEGLSLTRNYGIERAVGRYIMFVDADDYVLENGYGHICSEMDANHLDILALNYNYVDDYGKGCRNPYFRRMAKNKSAVLSGRDYILTNFFAPMVWANVYRKDWLISNDLYMLPIGHEDEEFTPRAIYLSRRIKFIPLAFYQYVQHKNSYMGRYRESNFFDMIKAMESLNKFKKSIHISSDKKIKDFFDNRIGKMCLMIFKRSIREGYPIQKKLLDAMQGAGLLPLRMKPLSFYSCFFNWNPMLFARYYSLLKKRRCRI